jgi:hypothetical protein
MKQLLNFLEATLLGGVLFVLPAWLAVPPVAKARMPRPGESTTERTER